MKKKNKFLISIIFSLMIIMTFGTTTYAASYEMFFNLKSGESKTGFATKKSSENFETRFYVRHYDCEPSSASYRTQKYNAVYAGKIVSNTISMLATNTSKKNATYYSGKAKENQTYQLRCTSTSTTHKNEIVGVSGVWTP